MSLRRGRDSPSPGRQGQCSRLARMTLQGHSEKRSKTKQRSFCMAPGLAQGEVTHPTPAHRSHIKYKMWRENTASVLNYLFMFTLGWVPTAAPTPFRFWLFLKGTEDYYIGRQSHLDGFLSMCPLPGTEATCKSYRGSGPY